jgi:hypothetical protein
MGSMLNINQLARKENLVIHLDASVANYTAYEFNSGSRNGTNASILDWPNRWTDLSGNNNHAYPIKVNTQAAGGVTGYSSSFFPITSSYLNNSVNIFGVGSLGSTDRGMRFNPIINENLPFSLFTWIKFNTNTSTYNVAPDFLPQHVIAKQNILNAYWGLAFTQTTNSGPLKPNFYWGSNNVVGPSFNLITGSWYQVGVTVDSGSVSNNINLYVNGQLISSLVASSAYPSPASQHILMGRPDWNSTTVRSNFNMSQLLVYNCALTPQEVWDNYQITKYKHQT